MNQKENKAHGNVQTRCIECGWIAPADFNKLTMKCLRCGKIQEVKEAVNCWFLHNNEPITFNRQDENAEQPKTATVICPKCGRSIRFENNVCEICGYSLSCDIHTKKKRKKHMRPIYAVIGVLAAVCIAVSVSQQNRKETENHRSMEAINTQLSVYEDENGYISPDNYESALNDAYNIVKQDETTVCQKMNEYCVYFEDTAGYGYVYVPKIEGYDTSGNDLRIVTLQPYYTENIEIDEENVFESCDHGVLDKNARDIGNTHNGWTFFSNDTALDDDVNDEEVSIERILSLDQYKIILWQGHGCYSDETGFYLMTNIYSTKSSRAEYKRYLQEKSMITSNSGTFALTEKFFELYFDDHAFDGALIYMGTCLSGYTESFADLLVSKGAAVVFVNSETIRRTYNLNMIDAIMSGLNNGYTISQALENAQAIYGAENTVGALWGKKTAYVYYKGITGAGDLTLNDITYYLKPKQAVEDMGMSVYSGTIYVDEDACYLQLPQPTSIAATDKLIYVSDKIMFHFQDAQTLNQMGVVSGTDVWLEGVVEWIDSEEQLQFLTYEIIEFSVPDTIVETTAEETLSEEVDFRAIYSELLSHLYRLCPNPTDAYLNNYSIYDIDENGIPELIVKSGTNESDCVYEVISIVQGEAFMIGTASASHSVLYGSPGQGLIIMSGHMGNETCSYIVVENESANSGIYYTAEVQQYWDEICQVEALESYALNDEVGLNWDGNPLYDNWSALEAARARVYG